MICLATSFYDETSKFLTALITSAAAKWPHGTLRHWTFIDGAYFLYPEGTPWSQPEQHETIIRACHAAGIGCTIHVPQTTWLGNEVQKRNFLFQAVQLVVSEGDWICVMDGDQSFNQVPADVMQRLEASPTDAAHVTFLNRELPRTKQAQQFNWEPISRVQIPILFRAQDAPIRVLENHYTYVAPDGRKLWGHGLLTGTDMVEQPHDLSDLWVDHRTDHRPKYRSKLKKDYYKRRDELQIERTSCVWCDEPGRNVVYTDISLNDDKSVEAFDVVACDAHAAEKTAEAQETMKRLGIPPDYFAKNKPVGIGA